MNTTAAEPRLNQSFAAQASFGGTTKEFNEITGDNSSLHACRENNNRSPP